MTKRSTQMKNFSARNELSPDLSRLQGLGPAIFFIGFPAIVFSLGVFYIHIRDTF